MSDLFTFTFYDDSLKFEMFKGAEFELICDADENIYDNVIDLVVLPELQIDNFPFLYNLMNAINIQYINRQQYIRDCLNILTNTHIEIAKSFANELMKIMKENKDRRDFDFEDYGRGYI